MILRFYLIERCYILGGEIVLYLYHNIDSHYSGVGGGGLLFIKIRHMMCVICIY